MKTILKNLKEFSKMQQAFDDIREFIKERKSVFKSSQKAYYEEINTMRIKYERGVSEAKNYHARCSEMDDRFQNVFIEKEITAKNDLENSTVKEFIIKNKLNDISLLVTEDSNDFTNKGDDMDLKIKALYLCIKRQLNDVNHPVMQINQEFSRVF